MAKNKIEKIISRNLAVSAIQLRADELEMKGVSKRLVIKWVDRQIAKLN